MSVCAQVLDAETWAEVQLALTAVGKDPFKDKKKSTPKRRNSSSSSPAPATVPAPTMSTVWAPAPQAQAPQQQLVSVGAGGQWAYAQPTMQPTMQWQPAMVQPQQAGGAPARQRPPCAFCNGDNHHESRCWKKHPEQRPARPPQ